jgi:hypothetical protein
LKDLETWLREINDSAAESLKEAFDELLTLHRLKMTAALRKALHTTNVIESMFSIVRDAEQHQTLQKQQDGAALAGRVHDARGEGFQAVARARTHRQS